jgi:hypothetical protein
VTHGTDYLIGRLVRDGDDDEKYAPFTPLEKSTMDVETASESGCFVYDKRDGGKPVSLDKLTDQKLLEINKAQLTVHNELVTKSETLDESQQKLMSYIGVSPYGRVTSGQRDKIKASIKKQSPVDKSGAPTTSHTKRSSTLSGGGFWREIWLLSPV